MSFGILTLIVACGLVGPLLSGATRLAVPVVVGEIAAGVLVGQTGLREINPADPTVVFLSAVGFAMLMFVVGTHLPLRDAGLRQALRKAIDRRRALVRDRGARRVARLARLRDGASRPSSCCSWRRRARRS